MCFDAEEDLMAQVVADHESLRGKVIVIRCDHWHRHRHQPWHRP